MSADWPWSDLGLDGPADERAVKSAYAARLKQIDRSDPEAFQQLRQAFEAARQRAPGARPARGRSRPQMRNLGAKAQRPPPGLRERVQRQEGLGPAEGQTERREKERTPAQKPEPAPVVLQAPEQAPAQTPAQKPAQKAAPNRTQPPPQDRNDAPADPPAQTGFFADPPGSPPPGDNPRATLQALKREMGQLMPTSPFQMRPDTLRQLDDILTRAQNLPGYLRVDLEKWLARQLIDKDVTFTPKLAGLMDRHFGWISDATTTQNRLSRTSGAQAMLYRCATAIPRKKKPLWKKLHQNDGPPLTLEEIGSFATILLALFLAVMQTALNLDAMIIIFFATGVFVFLTSIVLALALEVVWFLAYPIRVLGGEWVIRTLWSKLAPRGWKRWLTGAKPNKRGASLLISCALILTGLCVALLRGTSMSLLG